MQLLKPPREEWLLQYLSIRHDMPWQRRLGVWFKLKTCSETQKKAKQIQKKLDSFFSPEPDITSSLLNVYSRLKQDETLILKGWKLGDIPASRRRSSQSLFANGWIFRGTVAAGLASLMILFLVAENDSQQSNPARLARKQKQSDLPFAQVRYHRKNGVQVRYIKPELVKSVEFETTGTR